MPRPMYGSIVGWFQDVVSCEKGWWAGTWIIYALSMLRTFLGVAAAGSKHNRRWSGLSSRKPPFGCSTSLFTTATASELVFVVVVFCFVVVCLLFLCCCLVCCVLAFLFSSISLYVSLYFPLYCSLAFSLSCSLSCYV